MLSEQSLPIGGLLHGLDNFLQSFWVFVCEVSKNFPIESDTFLFQEGNEL